MIPSRDGSPPGQAGAPGAGAEVDAVRRWTDPPTHKARAAVERAVTRLLDALAPEQTVIRAARPPRPVERHRTPRGCVLQAPAAAVSVSWFPDPSSDAVLGELQILVWRGVVSRPGSAHRAPGGATIARALMLLPDESTAPAPARVTDEANDPADDDAEVERVAVEWGWRAQDGTRYHTDALAALCLALLEEQLAGDLPACDVPVADVPVGNVPGGNVPGGNVPVGDVAVGGPR